MVGDAFADSCLYIAVARTDAHFQPQRLEKSATYLVIFNRTPNSIFRSTLKRKRAKLVEAGLLVVEFGKGRKKLPDRQLLERAKIESELSTIPPLHPSIRKITSAEGFADYYLRMRDLYDTQLEAYERLEDFHIAITGKRRYSEFDSFRVLLDRSLKATN